MNVHPNPETAACWALLGAVALGAEARGDGDEFVPHELVVRLELGGDVDEINELLDSEALAGLPDGLTFLLGLPEQADETVFQKIVEALEFVAWAELNPLLRTMDGTTGSFFVSLTGEEYQTQYALDLIAPAPDEGGAAVLVAVLDTGIDAAHEALAGLVAEGGFDFVDMDSVPEDAGNGEDDDGDGEVDELVGHGTHVSGLVALAAPQARIIPLRVLDGDGTGSAFTAAQGVHHALAQGARVINISFGSSASSQVLAEAIAEAQAAGVVVVAAAGNLDQQEPVLYPAAEAGVIAVAGTDAADLKSGFSNYGHHIVLSAPGTQIVSTLPQDQYGAADGTSFAAAFVAAGAAQLLAQDPLSGPAEIAARLGAGADEIDDLNPAHAGLLGAGRLDIAASLDAGPDTPCLPQDLDADGAVGMQDLLLLLGAWGAAPGHAADFDGDGLVGLSDLLSLLAAWGPCS